MLASARLPVAPRQHLTLLAPLQHTAGAAVAKAAPHNCLTPGPALQRPHLQPYPPRTAVRVCTVDLWQVMHCGWLQRPQAAGINAHAASAVPRQDHKTVFVRNVSFKASDAEVADFFSQAGQVAQVRRQTDDQGGLTLLALDWAASCIGTMLLRLVTALESAWCVVTDQDQGFSQTDQTAMLLDTEC